MGERRVLTERRLGEHEVAHLAPSQDLDDVAELGDGALVATTLLTEHPELQAVGIAQAYRYAAENRERYREFFGRTGSLHGPGFTAAEAAALPEELRIPGVVVARPRASIRAS